MRITIAVYVEVLVPRDSAEGAIRLAVERLCLDALETAGLEPISLGATSRPASPRAPASGAGSALGASGADDSR
jgi:hypothetical protein